MLRHPCLAIAVLLSIAGGMLAPALADDAADQSELAKKTLNPVADLISLPLQFNYDRGIGPTDDGKKYVLNIQPVIPISIGPDWNVISRTILPIADQEDILPGGRADASGIGDITQSFFFSPKKPTAQGWIWGAGPVLLLPTATDNDLGGEKWGLGPYGGGAQAGARVHLRHPGQSYLVGCRGQRSVGYQRHLSPAVFSPTPRRRLPLSPSIPSRRTIGRTMNGRSRLTFWSARF